MYTTDKPYTVTTTDDVTFGPLTYYEAQAVLLGQLMDGKDNPYGTGWTIKRAALIMSIFTEYNLPTLTLLIGDNQYVKLTNTTIRHNTDMMHHITTPRRTALVGKIIAGEIVTMGLHHFCEYCTKYMLGHDETCPHCGKGVI